MGTHFREAAGHYQTALESYRQLGDRAGQATVLRNLGIIEHQLNNHQSVIGYYREAITACHDTVGFDRASHISAASLHHDAVKLYCWCAHYPRHPR